jgi:hypothetical protein
MFKKKWYAEIGDEKGTGKIEVIECLDSGNERIWVKWEPEDKSKPMEVCNILDQPSKVSWKDKNSHFETIDRNGKSNYYSATTAGSFEVQSGTIQISKDSGSKVLLFPLTESGSIGVRGYSETGSNFKLIVDKPTWIGYAISGSGTFDN